MEKWTQKYGTKKVLFELKKKKKLKLTGTQSFPKMDWSWNHRREFYNKIFYKTIKPRKMRHK